MHIVVVAASGSLTSLSALDPSTQLPSEPPSCRQHGARSACMQRCWSQATVFARSPRFTHVGCCGRLLARSCAGPCSLYACATPVLCWRPPACSPVGGRLRQPCAFTAASRALRRRNVTCATTGAAPCLARLVGPGGRSAAAALARPLGQALQAAAQAHRGLLVVMVAFPASYLSDTVLHCGAQGLPSLSSSPRHRPADSHGRTYFARLIHVSKEPWTQL